MNEERYDLLFDAWSESRLTPAEAAELSAMLRVNPHLRARFRADAAFHGQLHAAADEATLEQASVQATAWSKPSRTLSLAAMFLAVGLTTASFGWLFAARGEQAQARALGIHDGGFDGLKGTLPAGFPPKTFTWSGDPSEVAAADPAHPTALRFLEAAGEPSIPNSPRQSCDVFQIIDLRSVRDELLTSSEAFVELQTRLLDRRAEAGTPVRFIAKIYVFEGSPTDGGLHWPPQPDQILGSGAQFHVSQGGANHSWQTLTTRCILPPTAGFLVVQIGVGSAGNAGEISPALGAQFADDIRLTLRTREGKAGLASR
ncbi:MAG: hypothetical protein RLZZ233_78 [Verrucomicrobiota bacterium]|jgi:hypothetical protein